MSTLDLGNGRFSHHQIVSVLSNRLQQLIILPTEKCNFRCTYCYEDFAIGKMSEQTQSSIERFLERRIPDLSQLSINWFGGEPLVARDVVLRISEFAKALCDEHGVELKGGLTTNAYLLKFDLFERLLRCDQNFFQITFDGWRGGHDIVRRRADGSGTFDKIWSNLTATKDSKLPFQILIRIHIRRDNLESIGELLKHIAVEFGRDSRYALDFEHLRNLGGKGGESVERPMSLAELREVEPVLRAKYEQFLTDAGHVNGEASELFTAKDVQALGERSAISSLDTPYICYAAKPNSLLVRADGRIGKCTVALSDDRNTIGKIQSDGRIEIDNAKLKPWIRGLADLDEQTLECPLSRLNEYVQ